ncbi:nucleophile aminohydrolase [Trichoderma sp. SZMC 28011]
MTEQAVNPAYAIVLHAGAAESWIGDASTQQNTQRFLESVVAKAEAALARGEAAVDVVTDAVAALEDYPEFNAGRGSALNIDGIHELEAAIVDGKTLEYRAVAGLQRTKNPVRLASKLLFRASPAFIYGKTADDLASKMGLEAVENSFFTTPKRKQYWEANIARVKALEEDHGTAGAVALDLHGNLAAANTTGGMTFKLNGRVGDTAVLGAGILADGRVAIACSGTGEAILKSGIAGKIAANYDSGKSLDDTVRGVVLDSARLYPRSSCGVIALSADGTVSIQSNSRLFSVASSSSKEPSRFAGIVPASFPILDQHIIHADDMMQAGVAKYPTMRNQIAMELKAGFRIHSMNLVTFLIFFSKVRQLARAVQGVTSSKYLGFITASSDRALLFPMADGKLNVEKQSPSALVEPIWTLCPDGGNEEPPNTPQQNSNVTSFVVAPTNGEAIGQQSDVEAGKGLGYTEEKLKNDHIIRYWPFSASHSTFDRAEVSCHQCDSEQDLFSLDLVRYNRLLAAAWKSLRIISARFQIPLESLRIEIQPFQPQRCAIAIIPEADTWLQHFPAPAPFHVEYPGYFSTEYGALPSDMTEFSSLALDIRSRLRRDAGERAGGPWLDAILDSDPYSSHRRAEMQKIALWELDRFLGATFGYRFSPKVFPKVRRDSVSPLETLSSALELPYDCPGIYSIANLPSIRDESGSEVTIISVILPGTLINGMQVLSKLINRLVQLLASRADGGDAVAFTSMLQQLSAFQENFHARIDDVKKEANGEREKQQSHSLMLRERQVGVVKERPHDSKVAHRVLGDLYGDITVFLEDTESCKELAPVFTEAELNLSAVLESLWE